MMNSNPKLELHPDAESLNAFAERALGEQERGRILAHLSECGRCRRVVYLAQEAAVEMEPELAVAAAAAAPARESETTQKKEARFWNWRLAWVPAGALAVMVTAAYVVHVRQVEVAGEQAKAAREAAAQNVEMAAAPETAQMEMKAAPSPGGHALTGQAPIAANELRQESPDKGLQKKMAAAAPAPLGVPEATAESSSDEVALPGTSGAAYPAVSADALRKPEPATQLQQGFAVGAPQVQIQTAGAPPQAGTVKPVMHKAAGGMLAAAARSAQVEADRGPAGGEAKGQQMGGGVFALGRAKLAPLPSGLPTVSAMPARDSTVAVDGAGGVFVSGDAGSHWESVAKQWSGRAVEVRLQTPVAGESTTYSAGAVFEIVNDQGQVWVSTDGRYWKAK
jgi:hypothetical protein